MSRRPYSESLARRQHQRKYAPEFTPLHNPRLQRRLTPTDTTIPHKKEQEKQEPNATLRFTANSEKTHQKDSVDTKCAELTNLSTFLPTIRDCHLPNMSSEKSLFRQQHDHLSHLKKMSTSHLNPSKQSQGWLQCKSSLVDVYPSQARFSVNLDTPRRKRLPPGSQNDVFVHQFKHLRSPNWQMQAG